MIDIDLSKYDKSIPNNLEKENTNKIIGFLLQNGCTYVEDLLSDYLDLFTFDYEEFASKFNYLNKKYNGNLINAVREDMNILEEFYYQ